LQEAEEEEEESPKAGKVIDGDAFQADLDMPRSWEYVVQGQHDSSSSKHSDFSPKLVSCFPEDAVRSARQRGVGFVCTRGRRADSSVPNQDDFVLARHSLANEGHIALYGVFDGHGPAGHHCAAYARGLLPESLFSQASLLAGPEEALRLAFARVQEGMLQQSFDAETSGTTATVALVLHLPTSADDSPSQQVETSLYVANVGDSRAVLVSRRGKDVTDIAVKRLTRDHRPDDVAEVQRVQREGGEVRRVRQGSGSCRIFSPGCQWPALALTRSLGASIAATCGVSSEPEISSERLTAGTDELLVLGTDGLFEFCSTKEVATRLSTDGIEDEILEDICASARRRWSRSSYNDTVDDITLIAVSLNQSIGKLRPTFSPSDSPERLAT
jgi:serine/threonine protein phosphatase PrpC